MSEQIIISNELDDDNKFFEITPADIPDEDEPQVEQGVVNNTTERTPVTDTVMDYIDPNYIKQQVRQYRLMKDPADYMRSQLYATYNTTCVEVADVIEAVNIALQNGDPNFYSDVSIYEKPIYAAMIHIKSDWMTNLVEQKVSNWSTSPYPRNYVEDYLRTLGVTDEEMDENKNDLLDFLPESIKLEDSPLEYKLFKAVQLLGQENPEVKDFDYESTILNETESMLEYASAVSDYVEENVPVQAAEVLATEDAVQAYEANTEPTKEKFSIPKLAGNFCGAAIRLKYQAADTFNEAMQQSLGSYTDDWDSTVNQLNQRKAAKKEARANGESTRLFNNKASEEPKSTEEIRSEQRRQEMKLEHDLRMEEMKMQKELTKEQMRAQRVNQNVHTTYNNYGLRNRNGYTQPMVGYGTNKYGTRDFSPQIPLPVMVGGIHLIVALLLILIFGFGSSIIAIAGLIIALFGFIRKQVDEPKSTQMIVGGYALTAISLLFFM